MNIRIDALCRSRQHASLSSRGSGVTPAREGKININLKARTFPMALDYPGTYKLENPSRGMLAGGPEPS